MGKYLWNVLIAADQLGNALLAGDPRETISARLGRWQTMAGWRGTVARALCRVMHIFDKNHCADSAGRDEGD